MIHNIRGAFNELLADNHWMDEETRQVAKGKADSMNERIGYPEILTDRDELEKEYDNVMSSFVGVCFSSFVIGYHFNLFCFYFQHTS